MAKFLEGKLDGKGKKFAIVISRFNAFIAERLLEGALDTLTRSGVDNDDIVVARVPGAYEIPLVAQKMAASKKYDAIICLGVIIRGATPHFDFVANEAAKGIAMVASNGGKFHPGPTGEGAPQNAEVKFRDPDGVVFDISTHGWDGAKR